MKVIFNHDILEFGEVNVYQLGLGGYLIAKQAGGGLYEATVCDAGWKVTGHLARVGEKRHRGNLRNVGGGAVAELDRVGTKAAALIMGLERQTVINQVVADRLPSQKVGRDHVIELADIIKYMAARQGRPGLMPRYNLAHVRREGEARVGADRVPTRGWWIGYADIVGNDSPDEPWKQDDYHGPFKTAKQAVEYMDERTNENDDDDDED